MPTFANRVGGRPRSTSWKVVELDALLAAKGATVKGVKAEKAPEVAWCYTKEELKAWKATQEPTLPPPGLLAGCNSQRMRHDFFPSA